MNFLPVLASVVVVINARPDASHLLSGTYLPASHGSFGTSDYSGQHNTQDEKHVYFYGSSNGGSYTRYRINVVPTSKKITKAIFVKAPYHAGVIPEVVAPPSALEDKTLVYVLIKKPNEKQSVTIPSKLDVKQAQPQVVFIKYNNKDEAAAQINGAVEGQSLGVAVPEIPNQHVFVDSLGNGHGYNYQKPDSSPGGPSFRTLEDDKPITTVQIPDEIFQDVPQLPSEGFAKALGVGNNEGNNIDIQPQTTVIISGDDENKDDASFTSVQLENKKKKK
ncbi:hypothetical protein FQR65_LT03475 [Abscondita terminalis]|nr:hypothetical protein FQR65_LT03475 [Abscondita terminalis]